MICDLDDKDFCKRHELFHRGLHKELALADTPEGEKWRTNLDTIVRIRKAAGVSAKPFRRKPCNCGTHKGKIE